MVMKVLLQRLSHPLICNCYQSYLRLSSDIFEIGSVKRVACRGRR